MLVTPVGHHVSSSGTQQEGMSGQCSALGLPTLVSVPVGRSGWRVLVSCRSWLLPGSFRFLRECFSLTSDTDKNTDPITVHFCQVCPVYYCSGGFWAASSLFEFLRLLPSIFGALWQSPFRCPHPRPTVVTVTASMFSGFVFDTIFLEPFMSGRHFAVSELSEE